jgi:hypothetical protein
LKKDETITRIAAAYVKDDYTVSIYSLACMFFTNIYCFRNRELRIQGSARLLWESDGIKTMFFLPVTFRTEGGE